MNKSQKRIHLRGKWGQLGFHWYIGIGWWQICKTNLKCIKDKQKSYYYCKLIIIIIIQLSKIITVHLEAKCLKNLKLVIFRKFVLLSNIISLKIQYNVGLIWFSPYLLAISSKWTPWETVNIYSKSYLWWLLTNCLLNCCCCQDEMTMLQEVKP